MNVNYTRCHYVKTNFNHHSIMAVLCCTQKQFDVFCLVVGLGLLIFFFYFQIFEMYTTRYSLKQLIGLCFIFWIYFFEIHIIQVCKK